MIRSEVSALAKATSWWLNYKSLTGFAPFFSESILKVPISEYPAQTTWVLKTEVGYGKLPGADGLTAFWCDFAGERKYGNGIRFLLESKFLKRSVDQLAIQIAADVIRLSLPRDQGLSRFFLLAGKREHFQGKKAAFPFDKLFDLESGKGCDLKFQDVITSPEFLKSFPMYGKSIEISKNVFVRPKSAYVNCRAIEEVPNIESAYRVIIWSVSQAQLTPEPPQPTILTT